MEFGIQTLYLLDFNACTDENKVEEGEEENFSLSFRTPKRSQSPKHIKLKLPMSTLAGKISFFFCYCCQVGNLKAILGDIHLRHCIHDKIQIF